MAKKYLFKVKRGTSAEWLSKNRILLDGEPGYEKDTKRLKIGDGLTHWNDLDYVTTFFDGGDSDPETLAEHIYAAEPHPIYDDGPSFELLYQNAKV